MQLRYNCEKYFLLSVFRGYVELERTYKQPVTGAAAMTMPFSSTTYMTLCGLLRDAMLVPSDAAPVLAQAAQELAAVPVQDLPQELRQDARKLAALQQAGFSNVRQKTGASMGKVTARPVSRP